MTMRLTQRLVASLSLGTWLCGGCASWSADEGETSAPGQELDCVLVAERVWHCVDASNQVVEPTELPRKQAPRVALLSR